MKNFLIEFFRPLNNIIFNYFVKIGAIKPFVGSLVGGVVSGIIGGKAAKGQARRTQDLIETAYGELRDPSEIIQEAYTTGIYSPEIMDLIIGAERKYIPEFQELSELRARGIRDIQEESKLRQLGLLGQYGEDIREALEDPRLARLAGLDIAEAERLSAEAAGPLGVEAARTAEQTALSLGQRMGRVGDASTLARAALGRESAQRARREEAAGARQRALRSASAAMVDPSTFLFTPSIEEQIFMSTPLGVQVTDPGMATSLGSALDVQRAQIKMGKGLAAAQGAASSGNILGNILGGIDFSGVNFGSGGSAAEKAGSNLISGFKALFN